MPAEREYMSNLLVECNSVFPSTLIIRVVLVFYHRLLFIYLTILLFTLNIPTINHTILDIFNNILKYMS